MAQRVALLYGVVAVVVAVTCWSAVQSFFGQTMHLSSPRKGPAGGALREWEGVDWGEVDARMMKQQAEGVQEGGPSLLPHPTFCKFILLVTDAWAVKYAKASLSAYVATTKQIRKDELVVSDS